MPQILDLTPQWVVVSKPSGWLTIPGRNSPSVPVLLDWLRERHPEVLVVHRLDRETSGVLLFARTPEAHREANLWFSTRKVRKVYDFIAAGLPSAPVLKLDADIEGQPCLTQVTVIRKISGHFLGEARPATGRRHQIRIHLAEAGHPIWGDPTYGGPREVSTGEGPATILRVALHSRSLDLPTGERFTCPWPDDFSCWAKLLGANQPE